MSNIGSSISCDKKMQNRENSKRGYREDQSRGNSDRLLMPRMARFSWKILHSNYQLLTCSREHRENNAVPRKLSISPYGRHRRGSQYFKENNNHHNHRPWENQHIFASSVYATSPKLQEAAEVVCKILKGITTNGETTSCISSRVLNLIQRKNM